MSARRPRRCSPPGGVPGYGSPIGDGEDLDCASQVPFDDGDRARGFYGETSGWPTVPVPDVDDTVVMTSPSRPEQSPTEPGSSPEG